MKKEHKLQRNLDSTFEAELKICSLSGLTTWCSEWSVWGLGMGLGADCQVHICLGVAPVGVRVGVSVSASGLQRAALCCSLIPGPDGGMPVGTLGPLALGLSIPPPSLLGPPQKNPKAPGSPRLLSEPCIHSTCTQASFGFLFLSQTVVPKIVNL